MIEQNTVNRPIEINRIINESIKIFKKNFVLLSVLGLLSNSFYIFNDLFIQKDETTLVGGAVFLISFIIFSYFMMSLTYTSSKLLHGENVNLQESFVNVRGSFVYFFISLILYLLLAIGGLILLIIPGIYLGTVFTFSYIPIVLEKKGIIEGFKISKNLVKGNFWIIFFILVSIITLSVVFYWLARFTGHFSNILYDLFCVFVVPFITIFEVAIYSRLKEIKS